MAAYKSQISRKLNRYKKYPPEAGAKQLNGVVRVYFRIDAQGQVSAARMTQPVPVGRPWIRKLWLC
jgi:outer membrane biosynthesis protein TonB